MELDSSVVEEVATPCTGLSAARTRDLVHYEKDFPAFPRLMNLEYRERFLKRHAG